MHAIKTAVRILALTVIYFVCFAVVSGALLAPSAEQTPSTEAGAALSALLLVSLINAAVWSYLILRSRWTSGKLTLAVFAVFYGVNTVMPQIESAYFITRLPPGMLPRLFIAGLILAAAFAPLAVLILGKARRSTSEPQGTARLEMPLNPQVRMVHMVETATSNFIFGWLVVMVMRAFYR